MNMHYPYTSDCQPEFLSLDPELEQDIASRKNKNCWNTHACPDEAIIRRFATKHDESSCIRPAFSRDVDKIINIPAYQRYADKTQVFSFADNDDISRRSLHVQLVARVARTIGRALGLNLDLIEAIALGHDVGHTPFGHAGEHYLSKIYHGHTSRFFNHNIQSVRVLDKLYERNLSLQTLQGVMAHNGEFACQRLQLSPMTSFEELDFLQEQCKKDERHIGSLRPATLEAAVVRVSDMIAYLGKDRQDALDMGLIPSLNIFESNYLGTDNAHIIHNMTCDIITHSFEQPCIQMSDAAFKDIKLAKRQNYEFIYNQEGVMDGQQNYVEFIFKALYERLYDDLIHERQNSAIYTSHINYLARKSLHLDPRVYLEEDPHQIVVDFISSMTDSYFLKLFRRYFLESPCGIC